jgi:predicted small secreted protein
LTIKVWYKEQQQAMPVTGELIRMMNYVDDIATTLRRIQLGISTMNEEEKKRLADYMRKADPNYMKMLETLETK